MISLSRKDGGEPFQVLLEDFNVASLSLENHYIQSLESDKIKSAANTLYMNGDLTHAYLQGVSELGTIEDDDVKIALEDLMEEVKNFFENLHPDKNITVFNPLVRDGNITNYLPKVHKDYGSNALPNWRRYKAWISLNPTLPQYSLCLCVHKKEYETEPNESKSSSGNQKLPPLIGDIQIHEKGRWGWFKNKSQHFILFDGERVYHSAFQPNEQNEKKERRISIEIRITCTPK